MDLIYRIVLLTVALCIVRLSEDLPTWLDLICVMGACVLIEIREVLRK